MLREYYKAARNDAAVLEKTNYGIVKLAGSERGAWLQGMVTNDVEKLAIGQGCYAAHLNPQGKMVAHMIILRDEDCLWLVLERTSIPRLVAAFDKLLIMEDVQVSDESDSIAILEVIGPQSKTVLESGHEPLALEGLYSHRAVGDSRIVITDLGYAIWVSRDRAAARLAGLVHSGATRIDLATWDVLRTEAGLPVYGVDIDETTTMPELGERGISYDKGCYVGQEVVAKVKYIGHVNRRFVRLELEAETVPDAKSPIQKDGKDVGHITSSVLSPGLNKPIALGFVNRAAYAQGTGVVILSKGQTLEARIL